MGGGVPLDLSRDLGIAQGSSRSVAILLSILQNNLEKLSTLKILVHQLASDEPHECEANYIFLCEGWSHWSLPAASN